MAAQREAASKQVAEALADSEGTAQALPGSGPTGSWFTNADQVYLPPPFSEQQIIQGLQEGVRTFPPCASYAAGRRTVQMAISAAQRRLSPDKAQALPGQGTVVTGPGHAQELALSDTSSQGEQGPDALSEEFEAIGALAAEHQLPSVQETGEWEVWLRNNRTGEYFPAVTAVMPADSVVWRQYQDSDRRRYWYSVQGGRRRWFYHPEG